MWIIIIYSLNINKMILNTANIYIQNSIRTSIESFIKFVCVVGERRKKERKKERMCVLCQLCWNGVHTMCKLLHKWDASVYNIYMMII